MPVSSQPIRLLRHGIDVSGLAWDLREQGGLWDRVTARTADQASPHHGVSDIWARYGAPGEDATGPHESVWYAGVCDALPTLRPLVADIMHAVQGERLGGILITRIPPGGEVKPHIDPGWHARYYDKYALQIESAPGQEFCFDAARLETRPGDLYTFDNSLTHWVTNPTPWHRVTLIVCIRTPKD